MPKYLPFFPNVVMLEDGTLLLEVITDDTFGTAAAVRTYLLLAIYSNGEAEEILSSRQQPLTGAFGGFFTLLDGYGRVALLQIDTTGGVQIYRLHEE